MFGGFAVIGVYNLILFIIRRTDKAHLCFALLSIVGAVWLLISQQYFISTLFPALSWEVIAKIEYINLILALVIYGRFFQSQFNEEFSKYPVIIMDAFGAGLAMLILLTESDEYIHIVQVYGLAALVYVTYILGVIIKAMNKKRNGVAILLVTSIILLITLSNDIAKKNGIIIFDEYLSPYGLFIFILTQAFVISHRFFNSLRGEEEIATYFRIKTDKLEENENHLNAIFNSIASIIVSSDNEGRVVRSNLAAQNIFSDPS